ncbi:MAG: hypothetical protein LBR95_05990, partial [Azoarcus sp.]|nr:hypothetical protein [Azoarcus sp.]
TPPQPSPATVDVLPATAETAAPVQASACLAWSGLSPSQNTRLLSLLRAADIQVKTRDIETPTAWKVRLLPLPTREAAEILADSIVDLGIEKETLLVEESSPRKFSISLGVFANKANATRYLETIKAKGLHNSEIETRHVSERWIEAAALPAAAEAALAGQPFAKRHKPCQP